MKTKRDRLATLTMVMFAGLAAGLHAQPPAAPPTTAPATPPATAPATPPASAPATPPAKPAPTPPSTPPGAKSASPAEAPRVQTTKWRGERVYPWVEKTPVKTASSQRGVKIEDFTEGTGPVVPPGAALVLEYHGTLASNGEKFDSSYDRGDPAAFTLAQLIPGWQEGIPGMKVGGKRRLTVPFALAYGERGRPPTIPPRSDLVFDIHVLDMIQSTDSAPGTGDPIMSGSTLRVHMTLTIDGQKEPFYDSRKDPETKGEPVNLPLNPQMAGMAGRAPGLEFGMENSRVGTKRKLTLPPEFMWRNVEQKNKDGKVIVPPFSTIIAEIEVLGVVGQ